jgi:hypothetical protein
MDDNFLKDITNEREFLSKVLGLKVGEVENQSGFSNGLALLAKVYNEQLDGLVRLRIDVEIFNHLILAEPMDKSHLDNRTKSERALKVRRKSLAVIREQIIKVIEEMGNKPSGKKD